MICRETVAALEKRAIAAEADWQEVEERAARALRAAKSALAEHNNIRWDDIIERVDDYEDDDLGRFTRKYARYVRQDIEAVIAALEVSSAEGGVDARP